MTTAEAVIPAFGIEIDHPRNADIVIQNIPGCRLRSRLDGSRSTLNKDGEEVIPTDQNRGMGACPKVPGMEIHVNPSELTVVIRDPLNDDQQMMDRLTKFIRERTPLRTTQQIRGVPTRNEKLDEDQMKTLCRELVQIVSLGQAKRASGGGPVPDFDDVDELPGRYLLNPGLRTETTQPRYEDEWDAWKRQLRTNEV